MLLLAVVVVAGVVDGAVAVVVAVAVAAGVVVAVVAVAVADQDGQVF